MKDSVAEMKKPVRGFGFSANSIGGCFFFVWFAFAFSKASRFSRADWLPAEANRLSLSVGRFLSPAESCQLEWRPGETR